MRWATTILLIFVVAGCASTSTAESSRPDPSGSPTRSRPTTSAERSEDTPGARSTPSPSSSLRPAPGAQGRGTQVIVAASAYGPVLHDASGQPIYLFDRETTRRPRCYGVCADNWPPVLTTGSPRGRDQDLLRPALLGTTLRRDGNTQVTYDGHPLYFYAHEGKYEVLCHDVEEYGGTWLVLRPDGSPAPA